MPGKLLRTRHGSSKCGLVLHQMVSRQHQHHGIVTMGLLHLQCSSSHSRRRVAANVLQHIAGVQPLVVDLAKLVLGFEEHLAVADGQNLLHTGQGCAA